jgi:hypothetical protein
MEEKRWHLAQINIAKMIGESIDDPVMATFVAQLDEINTLAEGSPGFVWRLKDEGNNATKLNPYNDSRIIINMSVWQTLDDLTKCLSPSTCRGYAQPTRMVREFW